MYSEDAASTTEPGITLRDIYDPDVDNYNPWTAKDQLLEFCAGYDVGVDMYLFITKLAELEATWTASLGGTTHHLLEGHSWLVDRVTPHTLEQLQATDLITRPTIYLRGTHDPKEQLLRRSYWALSDTARDHLDMAAFRGLDASAEVTATTADAPPARSRTGDPNESLPHTVGVAVNTVYFEACGYDAIPYHCLELPDVPSEYTDRPYDVVVYDDGEEIVGQVEVETRVDDARGITQDAGKLMAGPGKSWWCLPSKQHANRCLQQLVRHDLLQPGPTDNTFPDDLSMKRSTKRLTNLVENQKYADAGQTPPVTGINTYDNLRAKVVKHHPAIMYPADTAPTH